MISPAISPSRNGTTFANGTAKAPPPGATPSQSPRLVPYRVPHGSDAFEDLDAHAVGRDRSLVDHRRGKLLLRRVQGRILRPVNRTSRTPARTAARRCPSPASCLARTAEPLPGVSPVRGKLPLPWSRCHVFMTRRVAMGGENGRRRGDVGLTSWRTGAARRG